MTATKPERLDRAIAAFDAANAQDPNQEVSEGRSWPKELLYAQRMSAMLARYVPDASEALQLAARCQHIQRWKIPRSEYPMTKEGYQSWRTRLREMHAGIAAPMLREAGYDDETTEHVCALIKKKGLKIDREAQALEDVVDLVFLESYLAAFVAAHPEYDEAKLIDILHKTAQKMSARGRQAALTLITLPAGFEVALRKAVGATP
jgi:hypothetical protein